MQYFINPNCDRITHAGPGSIPGQFLRGFWCTEWQYDKFLSTSVFPVTLISSAVHNDI